MRVFRNEMLKPTVYGIQPAYALEDLHGFQAEQGCHRIDCQEVVGIEFAQQPGPDFLVFDLQQLPVQLLLQDLRPEITV